jgi:hypothetical protein
MSEPNSGTEIARIPQKEIEASPKMNPEKARSVLQAIVDTPENDPATYTSPESIGGYSTEQVRQAEKLIAQSLMEKYDGKNLVFDLFHLKKSTPQGILSLSLSDDRVGLSLLMNGNQMLDTSFPLQDPKDSVLKIIHTGFYDYRSKQPNTNNLYDFEKKPTVEGFQHMVKGLRWMSANMLDWENPQTIMPEKLDGRMLSQGAQKNLPAAER